MTWFDENSSAFKVIRVKKVSPNLSKYGTTFINVYKPTVCPQVWIVNEFLLAEISTNFQQIQLKFLDSILDQLIFIGELPTVWSYSYSKMKK